jgi:hypothetical protein
MTDNIDLPRVDETFNRMLSDLRGARNMLWKATSPTRWDWQAIGAPITDAQREALTIASIAINDAKSEIDRAADALIKALPTDNPPRH